MRLPPIPFVVLDTETTGFVPRVHRIIEFASMRAEPIDSAQGKKGEVVENYEQLFSIPGEIPPQVQVLTRIKPGHLAGKPSFSDAKKDVLARLPEDCLLVGQNLGYDLSMLKGEGIDLDDRPWVDTSLLASLVFPELRSYSLQYMSTALKLNHEPAHRAMGDVRATLELFGLIYERLCELPPTLLDPARDFLMQSTPGCRMLFEVVKGKGKTAPAWLKREKPKTARANITAGALVAPPRGTVSLHEESLHPDSLQAVLDGAAKDKGSHWVAVKNLESALRKIHLPKDARVLYPPSLLLDPAASKRLLAQDSFTAEEATLAAKITWFSPMYRADIAVHGGERDTWNGKLACTETSKAYTDQFKGSPSVFVVDHRQLLAFVGDPAHAAHGALRADAHIIVDDASMLEDTATKAYGHACMLDDLRAAAQGDKALMSLVDLVFIWAEKTRGAEDAHLVTARDLERPETKGLRAQLSDAAANAALAERIRHLLSELVAILEPKGIEYDVRWVETRPNGSIHLHGAPERIDALLKSSLYDRFPTTLLVPEGSNGALPEVLPPKQATLNAEPLGLPPCSVQVTFREDVKIGDVLRNPPAGKTIVLVSSKRMIEQFFIDLTETLEEKGVTLICQGLSGGQGRMEEDFLASSAPVLWLLTPWMYEGVELAPGAVDHLYLDSVPFDHPGYPVMARRKNHYKNAFEEYCLPRVEHRLFRLLRTFCRHRTATGDMHILDGRLREKGYGPRLRGYVETISGVSAALTQKQTPAAEKPREKKAPKGQQSLF